MRRPTALSWPRLSAGLSRVMCWSLQGSIDWARSTRDLLNVLATVNEREAGFRSLKDTWADTTTPHGRLMLTVLGGLAEFERELIRARTGDGRARAKARGVRLGRPTALAPNQRAEVLQRLASGEAQAEVARTFNVSQATISRLSAASGV